jgi:hypothetical protein
MCCYLMTFSPDIVSSLYLFHAFMLLSQYTHSYGKQLYYIYLIVYLGPLIASIQIVKLPKKP